MEHCKKYSYEITQGSKGQLGDALLQGDRLVQCSINNDQVHGVSYESMSAGAMEAACNKPEAQMLCKLKQVDCVMEWTDWGPCSKTCVPEDASVGVRRARKLKVKQMGQGGGKVCDPNEIGLEDFQDCPDVQSCSEAEREGQSAGGGAVTSGAMIGAAVGLGVGGILLAILIALLVVYCSPRLQHAMGVDWSRKKPPTSGAAGGEGGEQNMAMEEHEFVDDGQQQQQQQPQVRGRHQEAMSAPMDEEQRAQAWQQYYQQQQQQQQAYRYDPTQQANANTVWAQQQQGQGNEGPRNVMTVEQMGPAAQRRRGQMFMESSRPVPGGGPRRRF
eukprot:GHVU01073051.1.p1 GENE.GHVU01073051.1~~GHVU01073051.1.p1  ORF type:complete len:330 (+),score=91.03 GHVU01073051.1:493-1482(+)